MISWVEDYWLQDGLLARLVYRDLKSDVACAGMHLEGFERGSGHDIDASAKKKSAGVDEKRAGDGSFVGGCGALSTLRKQPCLPHLGY